MQYKINDFSYDDSSGKFIKNDNEIQLTKAQKKLLNYFIAHPKTTISKQQLMDDVWGRVITENSIEKAISKLRLCIEEDALNPKILVTNFGHGISFEAHIVGIKSTDGSDVNIKKSSKLWIVGLIILVALSFGFYLYQSKDSIDSKQDTQATALLMAGNDDWLSSGSVALIEQLITSNKDLLVKNQEEKPKNLSKKQFVEYQWKIAPDLKIINSRVEFKKGLFSLYLTVTEANQKKMTKVFSHASYNYVIKQASLWLLNVFKLDSSIKNFENLLPENNFIMEIYLRGLEKLTKGELKAASNYFEICMNENPKFLPAYLKMAKVLSKQEELSGAMTLLETLSQLAGFQRIKIDAQILNARLFMQLNQQPEAQQYLEKILNDYKDSGKPKLYKMKSLLVSVYINLNKNREALDLLDRLEGELIESQYPELLRNVYYNKARVMQVFGKYKQAKFYVLKSKELSNQLGDLFSESAAFRLLSSISDNLGNENDITLYLNQALAISKSLKDDIGVAKTISFLVPDLVQKGKFNDAYKLNQEMENIVIKVNSNMGAMYAKMNYSVIARKQKQWQKAEIYLKQHMEIVQKAGNQRALLENRQNQIELLLAQDNSEGVLELIDLVQQQIDEGNLKNIQIGLNIKKARYYYLVNKIDEASELLYESKKTAQRQEKTGYLLKINMLLAERSIVNKQAEKALALLAEDDENKPYPYLLLKSKAYFQLRERQKALKFALECKNKANEFWSLDDENFLNEINNS